MGVAEGERGRLWGLLSVWVMECGFSEQVAVGLHFVEVVDSGG